MYRPEGATDFTEVKMKKEGDCKYTGAIPASAIKGIARPLLRRRVRRRAKPIASKGSSGSPNIIEITGRRRRLARRPSDNEDPIGGNKVRRRRSAAARVVGRRGLVGVHGRPEEAHVFIACRGGTGFGYVTGTTEGMQHGEELLLRCEPRRASSPSSATSSARRPRSVGRRAASASRSAPTSTATRRAAPGGLLRVRYALSANGEGVRVMGQVGAGILRNTIKLDNAMPGMDTDIVAQGPLLVGGGIGYTKHLSGNLSFLADLSALAGIAVVDRSGSRAEAQQRRRRRPRRSASSSASNATASPRSA